MKSKNNNNAIDAIGCTLAIFQQLDTKDGASLASLNRTLSTIKQSAASRKSLRLNEEINLPVPINDIAKFIFLLKKYNPGLAALNNQNIIKLFNDNRLNRSFYHACKSNRWMAKLAMDNPNLRNKLPASEFMARWKRALFAGVTEVKKPYQPQTSLSDFFNNAFNAVNSDWLNRHIKVPIIVVSIIIDILFINFLKKIAYGFEHFLNGAQKSLATRSIPEIAATVPSRTAKQPAVTPMATSLYTDTNKDHSTPQTRPIEISSSPSSVCFKR